MSFAQQRNWWKETHGIHGPGAAFGQDQLGCRGHLRDVPLGFAIGSSGGDLLGPAVLLHTEQGVDQHRFMGAVQNGLLHLCVTKKAKDSAHRYLDTVFTYMKPPSWGFLCG